MVGYVRRTSERDRGLASLGPFRCLSPIPPHEVSGITSTSKRRKRRPRQVRWLADSQSQKQMGTQAWPPPRPGAGSAGPLPGPLCLLCHETNREDGSLKVPSWRRAGPRGRPGPAPPHPSETHVSGLTAVFHWPATAAPEVLVSDAECSTTFSWRPRPEGRSGKLLYL